MKRFIITGAPGAGKAATIRQLEIDGFSVVEGAATDVIAAAQAHGSAQPWVAPSFIDAIANLQRQRQIRASYQSDEVQFRDHCAVCTAGLAVYLEYPSSSLSLSRQRTGTASKRKGSTKTESSLFAISTSLPLARRGESAFEDTVRFERIHEETYRNLGFELVSVEAGSLVERVSVIKTAIH